MFILHIDSVKCIYYFIPSNYFVLLFYFIFNYIAFHNKHKISVIDTSKNLFPKSIILTQCENSGKKKKSVLVIFIVPQYIFIAFFTWIILIKNENSNRKLNVTAVLGTSTLWSNIFTGYSSLFIYFLHSNFVGSNTKLLFSILS